MNEYSFQLSLPYPYHCMCCLAKWQFMSCSSCSLTEDAMTRAKDIVRSAAPLEHDMEVSNND